MATQYTLSTKSLEIYVSGCSAILHCENCHNPESWDFNIGEEYNYNYFAERIVPKVNEFPELVNNIFILGGEPLDQDHEELKKMFLDLKTLKIPIWLFTRYNFYEIPLIYLRLTDYIKCGRYIEELKVEDKVQYDVHLATSNQNIYKKGVDYK
jgi:anaerobic ribonucleoside-triphosphate reductase activating protein